MKASSNYELQRWIIYVITRRREREWLWQVKGERWKRKWPVNGVKISANCLFWHSWKVRLDASGVHCTYSVQRKAFFKLFPKCCRMQIRHWEMAEGKSGRLKFLILKVKEQSVRGRSRGDLYLIFSGFIACVLVLWQLHMVYSTG